MLSAIKVSLFIFLSLESTRAEEAVTNNCKVWPNFSRNPTECCSVPELLKPEVKDMCFANCSRPDDPTFNSWCCSTLCIFEELGLTADGSFSNEKAKTVLSKTFQKAEKIVKAIKGIIDKCDDIVSKTELKQDEGKTECETLKYGYIWSCIHQELIKLCPEMKADKECTEMEEFMKKCPNTHPPLKQTKLRRANLLEDNLGEAMKEVLYDKVDSDEV